MSVFGLDFGTTTTFLADSSTGNLRLLPIGREVGKAGEVTASTTLSSRVSVSPSGDVTVGDSKGIRSLKRELFRDPTNKETARLIGEIFAYIVKTASQEFNIDLTEKNEVRLGCPAVWSGATRRKLAEIAKGAGIKLLNDSLVEEAVAAGMIWAEKNLGKSKSSGPILVFDMGGGTLDVAVIDCNTVENHVNVLASVGSVAAGDEADSKLFDLVKTKASTSFQATSFNLTAIEGAKIALSMNPDLLSAKATIALENGSEESIDISRKEYTEAMSSVIEKALATVDLALKRALLFTHVRDSGPDKQAPESLESNYSELIKEVRKVPTKDIARRISAVVLAGGMTQSPDVVNMIAKLFDKADLYRGSELLQNGALSQAQNTVSFGLASNSMYSGLNFDRPHFDIFVEWNGGRQYLYQAATDILNFDLVLHAAQVLRAVLPKDNSKELELPTSNAFKGDTTSGKIVFRSIGGKELPVEVSDEYGEKTKLWFDFGSMQARTIFYLPGKFVIYDGTGNRHQFDIQNYGQVGLDSAISLKIRREKRIVGATAEPWQVHQGLFGSSTWRGRDK
jgi:actin-like ATPase involved in cell morphogenesis